MKPLISVIVPVYKVEDVLSRCLESLCRQSFSKIEILLIDDASPDRSGDICEEYAAKDARFKVIHHPENKGLSVARNTGIACAACDYLMFVDSDDWVHEDFCKLPYECAVRYKADIVVFGYERIGSRESFEKKTSFKLMTNGYKTRLEAIDLLLKGSGPGTWTVWNKFYKKELFKGISYPPNYYYEDIGTTYKIFWRASHIYYLNEILYFNCFRESSITTLKTQKALQDKFEMHIRQFCDLLKWGYPREKLDVNFGKIALSYCINKKKDYSDPNYSFCANYLRTNKTILKDFSFKRKILLTMFNYCPSLFELICKLWNKKVY